VRLAALAFVALVATGCMGRTTSGDEGGRTLSSPTMLEISVSPGGEAPTKTWTLRCPDGVSSLPQPARACRRLERIRNPFAPAPKGASCTQVYGGPQEADVRGLFRGRPVQAHFDRGNGCEIARWNKVRFLFPSG
jgi:Subtilisin inhibitor-like